MVKASRFFVALCEGTALLVLVFLCAKWAETAGFDPTAIGDEIAAQGDVKGRWIEPARVDPSPVAPYVQDMVDGFPSDALPSVGDDGRIQFPEPVAVSGRFFAETIAAIVREAAQDLYPEHDAWDTEFSMRLGSNEAFLRIVVGSDGSVGEDGVSVKAEEDRPGILLIVAAGNGGPGLPGQAGGAGGNASGRVRGTRSAAIGIGGHAGAAGPANPDPAPNLGPPPGGQDGGDVQIIGDRCQTVIFVMAVAGNGGSAPPPAAPGAAGGAGGRGGNADALCTTVLQNPPNPCEAVAIAGNAGHGASGANNVGAGGGGGGGGLGGRARASSCCDQRPGRELPTNGDAGAVGGSGGHGGNGGNSILAAGGVGADGGAGGGSLAVVTPGIIDSTAYSVAGSGGNGGNGGNGNGGGGAGGLGGAGAAGNARNLCDPGAVRRVSGRSGVGGVRGNP